MMGMLLWLTVSTPFVYAQQQHIKKEATHKQDKETSDQSSNPLTSTNEEKSEDSINTISEYLHQAFLVEHHFITLTSFYKCHSSDLYLQFHPETISPPPDLA